MSSNTELNIDGTGAILGRLASVAAKQALLGKNVNIMNCEGIIISGDPKTAFNKAHQGRVRGNHFNGPFISRLPDRYVRRSIKRMLPFKKPRGAEAYKRIMCYLGVPEQFKDKELDKVAESDGARLRTLKFMTVQQICRRLGGKQ